MSADSYLSDWQRQKIDLLNAEARQAEARARAEEQFVLASDARVMVLRELARKRSEIPEGIDQREADIALSKEVEQQALTRIVVEAGALMFCGERDLVAIAGKALLGLWRQLDDHDLLDEDMDEAMPGYIADIAERLEPDDMDGDDGE